MDVSVSQQSIGRRTPGKVQRGIIAVEPASRIGETGPEKKQPVLLESRTRLGEGHRDGFLHEIVKNEGGSAGNHAGDKTCGNQRTHGASPDLDTV